MREDNGVSVKMYERGYPVGFEAPVVEARRRQRFPRRKPAQCTFALHSRFCEPSRAAQSPRLCGKTRAVAPSWALSLAHITAHLSASASALLSQGEPPKTFIYNHLRFTILYHRDPATDLSRIVGFEVEPFR